MIRKTKERNVDRREVVPLKGGGAQYELPQKGNVYTMGWTPFLSFIGIFIFAFGGMFIIILCTEHLTELPKDHELYQSVLGKTDTAEKVESRVKRMERNILDSKSHTLEKEAVEENPNLLDMSKKPTQLYAPRQPRRRNSMFDNLWGPKKDNKKKSAEELKKEEDEHHDWMKDLFPHLYDDDKEKGKDGKKMKKDPWANLFGAKGDDDDSFGNLFGNPSKKTDKDGGKKNNDPFGNLFKPKREVPSPNSAGMNSNQNTKVPPKNTNQQVPPRNINQQVPPRNTNQQVPPRNTNQQQQRATPPVNGRPNINQQGNSGTTRGNYNAPPNTYYNQNQQQQRGNINQQQQGNNNQQRQKGNINQQQQQGNMNQQQQQGNINQQQQGNINQQQQGNINQQQQQRNINQQQQGNINQQQQQGNINQQRQQGNINQQQQQGNINRQQQQPQGNFRTNVNQQMRGNPQAPQNAQPIYTNQQRQQQAYVPPQNQQQAYVPPQNQKNQQNQQPIYNQQQQPNGYGQQQQQAM